MAQKGRSWACGFQGGSGSLSRAPGLPLPRAGLSPGGPQQHFLYVLAPFSPSVTSQSPRITASPRHPCSGPESPQVARGSHRGVKDPGEGKEERAAAPPPRSFANPRAHHHPCSGRNSPNSTPSARPVQVHPGTHCQTSR